MLTHHFGLIIRTKTIVLSTIKDLRYLVMKKDPQYLGTIININL